MSGTRRTLIARHSVAQITPNAVDLFVAMGRLRCTCPSPKLPTQEPCPGCARWYDLHADLHVELRLKPWEWPCVSRQGDGEVCGGERIKGANCSTGGCAVAVYARVRGAWRKVHAGRNDPFVSADWTRDPPALRILVVSLYGDAPECPVREANLRAHGSTAWKHGQCDVVSRWGGTRFVYRMLVP
jgi:hypothetical protein